MDIHPYDESRDLKHLQRIWYEVGWVENESQAASMKDFLSVGSCLTARMNGEAECSVQTVPGTVCHMDRTLSLCAVTAVTTSRVARKQGFAQKLTALQLAAAASQGSQVAALGMFDQGFYDKLGFGTGAYEHQFTFDPASLIVDVPFAVPARLNAKHWQQMHSAMVQRLPNHGSVTLTPPEMFKAETGFSENGHGLGYFDGDELTHFIWFEVRGEHGPYVINQMAYRSTAQLMELLSLLKSLADQVSSVKLMQPPHVQLQALLRQPLRQRRITRLSDHANEHRALAWWQLRLLNMACVAGYCWEGAAVKFNLQLTDPVEPLLRDQTAGSWQGIGGDYVVEISQSSSVSDGLQADLPTLRCSVNAFSRLFFGVASASVLQVSDDLDGPAELMASLDRAFCLPQPSFGWDF